MKSSSRASVYCGNPTSEDTWRHGYSYTDCPKIYRKSLLRLLKYRFALYLSRFSTDLR